MPRGNPERNRFLKRVGDTGRMIPMKTSSIFKSRWMALIWAAGIIWFAYDLAESTAQADGNSTNNEQATDATGAPITPDNEKQFENALNSI